MACSYCVKEGLRNIPDAGTCAVCGRTACGPGARHDPVFHGDACECRCNMFVCHVHYSSHSRGHGGGTPARCFPAPTMVSAGGALAVIEHRLGPTFDAVLPIAEQGAINDFVGHFLSLTVKDPTNTLGYDAGGMPVFLLAEGLRFRVSDAAATARAEMAALAPFAINYFQAAYQEVRDFKSLPQDFSSLGSHLEAMETIEPLHRRLHEPMSPTAIAAYAALSPRIAGALEELAAAGSGGISSLVELVTGSRPASSKVSESPIVRYEATALSALLPGAYALLARS